MPFAPKNFEHLLGTAGFSEQLLKNHFKLYEGYVNNINALVSKLEGLTHEKRNDTPEFAELQRRLGWEFNGMRLHEYYFDNISKTPTSLASKDFQARVAGIYGSWDAFLADFKAVGKMRGIGWVMTVWDPVSKEFFNIWVNEHDVGLLAGCNILLVMDVFEHAYITDYGLNRAGYIDSFLKAIDWKVVESRF
ncbi:MAG: Fe-Mn family superoxide dismutase [Candidatus Aenigmatarchaeota archaeon]